MFALHVSCTGVRPVLVHAFGCMRGVLRVCVVCALCRVRGACGCACAGRDVFASGLRDRGRVYGGGGMFSAGLGFSDLAFAGVL